MVNGVTVKDGQGPIMGPTKGLTVTGPAGQVRLMLPGEGSRIRGFSSASIYSDDHGKTWHSNGTEAVGEMDWTVCSPGACGGSKYAMINRARVGTAISFSNDTVNWTPQVPTHSDALWSSRHSKPGIVSVPGGLVMSGQLMQCPVGVRGCARKPSDVIAFGFALYISRDGINWKLLRRLWPYGGMYSTMIPLTVDKDGAALTYAVVYACGAIGESIIGKVNFAKFSFSPSDFDVLDKIEQASSVHV
jgi:hypothetical protein